MTRLQKAKKQLSEALVALESAIEQASSVASSTSMSQIREEKKLPTDLPELLNEVSVIETKVNEAIAMIASMEASTSVDEGTK